MNICKQPKWLDDLGVFKGQYNENPILDTRVYEVMFPNGVMQEYSANVIAENMWAQVEEDGYPKCCKQ